MLATALMWLGGCEGEEFDAPMRVEWQTDMDYALSIPEEFSDDADTRWLVSSFGPTSPGAATVSVPGLGSPDAFIFRAREPGQYSVRLIATYGGIESAVLEYLFVVTEPPPPT